MGNLWSGNVFTLFIKAIFVSVMVMTSFSVSAELYFNPRFLADNPDAVADLSHFEKGQEVLSGNYLVDIYLNDNFIETRNVTFHSSNQGNELIPCITRKQLNAMGVNAPSISEGDSISAEGCAPFSTLINAATSHFDVSQQRLYLTVPQIYMVSRGRGYISPDLWDDGINAGLLNYIFTGNKIQQGSEGTRSYAYMNLQSGINVGAWHLRDNSNWSYTNGDGSSQNKWQHINTWLERDIVPLRARLTLGDRYTSGALFEGINYRGVQLATEEGMLPDSQRGFAPVIRGIARSTAIVSVKQNGYEIYQTTVSPGPFKINDLYASGGSGDMEVTIKENDGHNQVFTLPWSSLPVMQREGNTRYMLVAGEFRSGNSTQNTPEFAMGTIIHGLPKGWTVYSGGLQAARYSSISAGVAKNMDSMGAVSFDITRACASLPDGSEHVGNSARFQYSKSINSLGSNVQLAGAAYSPSGYFTFADTTRPQLQGYTIEEQNGRGLIAPKMVDYYNLSNYKQNSAQISLTQPLGAFASLYLSGSWQTYWRTDSVDEQLQAGLFATIEDISWSLNYSRVRNSWTSGGDQILSFNVNVPFSHWIRSDSSTMWRNANASYSLSQGKNGRTNSLLGIYGTLLEDNNLSYSLQEGYNKANGVAKGTTDFTSFNYRSGYGNVGVGYSRNDNIKQLNYNLSGGVIAHANGITLSQPLNDTVILVKAPGARQVKIENQTGVSTDWRGYAVVPYATEYRENRVALNTTTLANNVELDDTVVSVIPTRGAVARANFTVRTGVKMLITLLRHGVPLPFGAIVTSDSQVGGNIVADNGQVYLSGMPLEGKIQAKWGDDAGSSCVANYHLPVESQNQTLNQLSLSCI